MPFQVPALCFVLRQADLPELRAAVKEYVGLTHTHADVLPAADTSRPLDVRDRRGLAPFTTMVPPGFSARPAEPSRRPWWI